MEPVSIREACWELSRQPVVELLDVPVRQLDHAEAVPLEQLQFLLLPLRVLRRVEAPVLDAAVADRAVEVDMGILRHGASALTRRARSESA